MGAGGETLKTFAPVSGGFTRREIGDVSEFADREIALRSRLQAPCNFLLPLSNLW